MRTPGGRVVLVALAAAGVLVGGKLATRHGPVGGSSAGAAHAARTAAAAATSGPAGLGSLSDRLARLPELRPGELHGTLVVRGDDCSWQRIALATLRSTRSSVAVCAEPGAAFGIPPLPPANTPVNDLPVVDLAGRPTEVIHLPRDLDRVMLVREGLVFCPRGLRSGRLRRFGGRAEVLPGCPVGLDPLLFAGPGRRSIVDRRGHRIAALRTPLPLDALVSTIGDGVLAVGTSIYRGGRLLAAFDEPGGIVLGASRDGRVALIGNGTGLGLFLYRNGVARPIDTALATHAGAVSPDGSRLLVQHGLRQLIELDAATLRPLARIELATAPDGSLDWLATGG
jgi:hypothetical protein